MDRRDLSPFAPDSFHRKLATYSERDLRLELGLRWAYGLAHVVNTGTDPYEGARATTSEIYMRELAASFLDTLTTTLENELPLEFAKGYARQFAEAIDALLSRSARISEPI